jgi:hypothetical protein
MLTLESKGGAGLVKQIAALNMPANRRKRWHTKMGRQVIKSARQNIKAQRTVDGQGFKASVNGKRVLRKIARGKNLKVFAGPNTAKVTWPNALVGKIARAQQEGHKEQYTPGRMKREQGESDYDTQATAAQAKALIKAGYKLHKGKYKSGKNKGGSKTRRVSQAWIRENMTLGQAGLVLRMLRDNPGKQSWETEVPERPFFGLNGKEIETLGNQFINDVLQDAKSAR